ncbi:DUF3526 domain-containing protein [Xanthomonas oryzae pv. oryzae]|uniref:ABC transporter permease n=2 Tax=Xanthomonas oryzae TaxID=347 RepID=UPI0005CE0E99|nr:DUF3526 domain-containing protein [Xanthomonas oryzae]AJQ83689.1 hypothetical protein AZ54_14705 [Xanthomonas oryzae pv. oryzae PXO86]ALZ72400.1 hypothetical protein APZ20_13805 [Xanthomonas oryzae pv. oryzae]AOS02212.1 hypothetical protein ATY42_09210 [Xanthomonas oryzae pv. oryzae]AOS05620.1 hypothetical protein ATY43_05180 [Xanthomonas oryzae pv. oryzae]AOS11210.1 hypothetical protein ATY44_13925 [Xanthomonas oryzae pv. oryzae]
MMASIARKETLALLRDGRLWSLGLTLALLFIAMLFTAVDRRDKAEQERSAVEHAVRDQWDHQGDKNPHRAAHFGLYAFKPRSALSSVEPGVDAQTGQALWLEPHKRNMAMFTPAVDAAPALGLGAFTPAFVLLALVPLLIAILGHSTVTQERELGTLRMLHACGARATPLLLGKWLGLCAGLALVLAPALIVGAWGMMADPRGMAAAASLGAALLPYYATWAAGTVLVSAFCTSSRAALLVMIAFWIAAVFIVPRLAASWVEHIAPLPTGEQFWSGIHDSIEKGLPGDGAAAARLGAFDAHLLAEYRVARLEDLPFGANAKRRLFRDAYSNKVHALRFKELEDAQLAQQGLLRWCTVLSPYAAMRSVASALAGTDLAHRQHFEESAEAYRQQFTTRMDEWDLAATRGVTSLEDKYAGNLQWQAIPPWRYADPGLGCSLRAVVADGAVLAAWFMAAVSALWLGSRRLDPCS